MLATPTQTEPGPNFDAIKQKQQAAWGSGDYSQVGITLQITGESLCEAMDMRAGSSVLDVAAGNGNATLAAARRFTNVVSTDYVQSLLDRSMARANAEGLTNIDYQIADAESLPFDTASFDNVISTFGVMFASNQTVAAIV
jgi:ubiquinone/menaquinone biosynthesis C-methylase UbiE